MDHILLDHSDRGIATISLNRPAVHGAFNDTLIRELKAAFASLAADPSVRVIILTGTGKSFSAGADLNWMKAAAGYSETENRTDARGLSDMLNSINSAAKPVIGLINGAAFGGGVGLTAVCDMAVAVESAKFCLSEVRLGLTPATISPFVLAKMGESHARRYFLTGERFSAAEARRIGLIHETAATLEDATSVANDWADALLAGAPGAIADAKALALDFAGQPVSDSLRADSAERIARRRASEEGQEGMRAFLAKSKPEWSR